MKRSFSPQDIVVATRSLFPFLYGLKDEEPGFAYKLVDADALLNLASFNFVNDPIPSLLVKGFSYPNAKRYSLLLRLGLAKGDIEAKRFLDELGAEGVDKDPLGIYELNQGKVYFFEMKEDIELHRLLRDEGIDAIDIGLEDLGVSETTGERNYTIFANKFEQFSYIFSQIRAQLLLDSSYAKKCMIHISGIADVFYARLVGKMFGIETYYRYRSPLLSRPAYSELYRKLCQRNALQLDSAECETEEGKETLSLIKQYRLLELPEESGLARLYEILSSRFVNEQIGDRGILLTDSFSVQPQKEIYLTCFQDGPFYKSYADDDIFPDGELERIGFNPSYVKTALQKRNKALYLKLNRFALISRVKEHLSDIIYDSPLAKELRIEVSPCPSIPATGVFTSSYAPLFRGAYLDASFYSGSVDELKSYDSRFKGIRNYQNPPKKTYSVTNLESYANCPYAYYLKKVIPDEGYDPTRACLGVMLHKILENIDDENFDYDRSFLLGVDAYVNELAKRGYQAGAREDVLFAVTKENFRRYVNLILSRKKHSRLAYSYSELPLKWTLSDGEKTYSFYGIADKVSVYKNGPAIYFAITDFKTGGENFLPYGSFLGVSTQLPLYAYAICNGGASQEIEGKFAGIGLQHVYPSSLKNAFIDAGTFASENGYSALALDGVYLDNADFWDVLDDTADVDKGKKAAFKGAFVSPGNKTFDVEGKGFLSGISKGRPYSLDELIGDAIKGTLETIRHIEKGEFPISPAPRNPKAKIKDGAVCSFCDYRDVCYRDLARDGRETVGLVKAYFAAKKGEDDAV